MDYREFYDVEAYLFDTVGPRFRQEGSLDAFDFFCIVIWKANRAKSRVARRLLARGYPNLESAVRALTSELASQPAARERLRCLICKWRFRLPMASAILTVLYPEEFSIYDQRVCSSLGAFAHLSELTSFDALWDGYQEFLCAVRQATPEGLTLRERDRYLWGKAFHDQLVADLERGFGALAPPESSPMCG
ncbi:MAG: hypothetical protein K6V36_15840 [Anaerolineae bacterium]|nr:hypothetical protein [Anaerolineae bacterium]